MLEIGDEGRYDQYDILIEKPKHLIPRNLRFTVPERVDVQGEDLVATGRDLRRIRRG